MLSSEPHSAVNAPQHDRSAERDREVSFCVHSRMCIRVLSSVGSSRIAHRLEKVLIQVNVIATARAHASTFHICYAHQNVMAAMPVVNHQRLHMSKGHYKATGNEGVQYIVYHPRYSVSFLKTVSTSKHRLTRCSPNPRSFSAVSAVTGVPYPRVPLDFGPLYP